MLNVVTRIGAILKSLVSLGLETLAIGTEAAKLAAEHLDAFVDELGTHVAPPTQPATVTARLGDVARDLAATGLSVLAVGTEVLKLTTKHLDGFLDDLNERVTGRIPPTPPGG